MRREFAGGSRIVDREDRGKCGLGSVVGVLEESRGSEGSDFGIGERRFLGGLEAGGRDSSGRLAESIGVGVAWGWKVTGGQLGGLGGQSGVVAGDRWRREELAGREVQDPSEGVGGRSAGDENASRDRQRVGESSSVRRAVACSASHGELVRAAGQLAPGGGRSESLIGDNVRHIKTCIRPRSLEFGEQEGFASYVNSAGSSLRSELVVVDRGDRDEVETTG